MISCKQLRTFVIQPVLQEIGFYSSNAEEILVATCAHESLGGSYISQVNGPARGPYQMEGRTHADLWERYIPSKKGLEEKILQSCGLIKRPVANEMVWNLKYATIMARIFYLEKLGALPDKHDIDGIWNYYKRYWNTELGSAKKQPFLNNYAKYIST